MQTGNTIFTSLGLAALIKQNGQKEKSWGWVKSLTAICCFQLGALFFSRWHRIGPSPVRRWLLMSSFALQALLLAIAATLVTSGVVPVAPSPIKTLHDAASNEFSIAAPSYSETRVEWMVLIALGILAFQSAGQAVASRVLGYQGLPTGVLTSLYVALWSDPLLFTRSIGEDNDRNERVMAVVVLILGAVIGGLCTDGSVLSVDGALWIAVGIKVGIVGTWWLWAPEPLMKRNVGGD